MKRFCISLLLIIAATAVAPCLKADDTSRDNAVRYYITVSCTDRTMGVKTSGAQIQVCRTIAEKAGLSSADMANINKYKFPTLADAANYLAPYGWKLDQAYTIPASGQGQTTVWVLCKDVTKDLQLSEGLSIDD